MKNNINETAMLITSLVRAYEALNMSGDSKNADLIADKIVELVINS